MPVNVVMPQMGESVTEGTVVRWIRKIGDQVDRDEPLFEISTDKVDAEIPSPAAGTLAAIHVKEGETVPVDALVAVIAQAGEAVEAGPQASAQGDGAPETDRGGRAASACRRARPRPRRRARRRRRTPTRQRSSPLVAASPASTRSTSARSPAPASAAASPSTTSCARSRAAPRRRPDTTPESSHDAGPPASARRHDSGVVAQPQSPIGGPAPAFADGERVAAAPFSVMRKKIAEHMVHSQRTAAHVHSVFEVDFSHVDRLRQAKKADYERAGVKLTFLSFIAKAVVEALQHAPILNASHKGDTVVYSKDVNLGIAVALDWGLIVPVIHRAQERDLRELSRGIVDLATRARAKQLKNEEVHGGTFTITNPGTLGAQFGMPIINQPQLAILGVGTIEKRPVVIDDGIAIRLRAYLTLGFDHRLIDGIVADQFMALVKDRIEHFDPAAV